MIDATPLLRLYARQRLRRLARQRPAETQERQLLRLVRRAEETRFGRDHGFARILSVRDFQERVPIRRYEAMWADYWRPAFPVLTDISWPGTIPYFAASSGTTTGRTKYIPVSHAMLRANTRAAFDLLTHHIANRPESRVFGGRSFMLGGSTDLVAEAPGIHSGDLSGIAARAVPGWLRGRTFPPPDLALLADWGRKVEAMGRRSLAEDIRALGGTTSWLLLFLDRLAEMAPDRPRTLRALYPRLELLVYGGVSFAPYRAAFERWVAGAPIDLREVYPASEGFLALADRGVGEGLRVLLDTGLFLEFVPVEELGAAAPRRFWIANVGTGVNYAVVLSSCAGAWAYLLGDTVRFVDLDPPRLLVTGRTSYMLSAFGEHLIGEEIERAVTEAAEAVGTAVTDFAVGPVFAQGTGTPGGHLYVVEFADPAAAGPRLAEVAARIDGRLSALNDDYRAHRAGGFGMDAPRVELAPPGTFAAWMRARGKLGGQNKVPRVITDADLLASLRRAAAERRPPPV
ncbi:GH3 auxin-responsive promoter family protein [Azospirillum sp. TSO22-1]|uniref:GH3 family domain-containing protein n=1 Tax=Azospirillum sp. TSO22-1 TaxID=716789 RepID=UPI000D614533|nr:GH3 auxin-responsive promoter family protein [Azospirillum sp. TSO22-1]PWC41145.1 auxin-regulated protein [Azospirillum sp. TSO22-1]